LFSRLEFEQAVRAHRAERYAKGFSSWDQFVAMLFCQLAQAHSLREICGGLSCCLGKVVHLGLREVPKRSTLAYANEHRPWELYQTVFHQLLAKCQGLARGKTKFRFHNKLYSMDATTIDLCLTLFDWARFRQTKGAVKLHLLLDHEGYLPTFAHITDGKTHDVKVAQTLDFPSGSIVVLDRGYNDYHLFSRWTDEGVFFVTRLKRNATYRVVERRPVPEHSGLRCDQIIRLSGPRAQHDCPHLLRRVAYRDPDTGKVLVFLTNHLDFAPTTIARIYKDRWQIEIFFKTLKQNLKVKTFVGTSCNALHTQIWTALIAMLLLKYLQLRSRLSWALSTLVAFLRWNLFTYRDLWTWINDPFQTPPGGPPVEQLTLPLPGIGQQKPGA
jgi:hypothetical protein